MDTAIVWFRRDLRLQDNPALRAAIEHGYRVLPLYISATPTASQTAADWWQHHALADLSASIASGGGELCLRLGTAEEVFPTLIDAYAVKAIYWNRRYAPDDIELDTKLKTLFKQQGLKVQTFNGSLLHEPWQVLNNVDRPYRVFTPYWKACMQRGLPNASADITQAIEWQAAESATLDQLELLPEIGWDSGFNSQWQPTREAGLALLQEFLQGPVHSYDTDRDRPDMAGTSRLSPYLQSGLIGVREVVSAVEDETALQITRPPPDRSTFIKGSEKLLSELGWREFSYSLLFHNPECVQKPLQEKFVNFPWEKDHALLSAWKKGLTGYPIVDAGMRELWHTGWMHNRVRMIVASFLVKHLMQPWKEGAAWFMHTLLDADLASNTQGWQWTAGCGVDAAPFFRIFNPVSQGKKFDPDGAYVRRWIPELKAVPLKKLHEPWLMDSQQQVSSDCEIGKQYPAPIVDLAAGRKRALEAWQSISQQ